MRSPSRRRRTLGVLRAALAALAACCLLAGPGVAGSTPAYAAPAPGPATSTTTTTSPPPPQPRIVGGTTATPGAGPWTVALIHSSSATSPGQFCGGSLVAPSWVLTAAHCLTGETPGAVDIYSGSQDLAGSGQRVHSAQLFVHPSYNPVSDQNDLGLIRLARPSSAPVLTIMDPGSESAWTPGTVGQLFGWGALNDPNPEYPDLLHQVDIPVLADSACSASGVYGSHYQAASMACGGYVEGGRDACYGDSGGPWVVPYRGAWAEIGLVSYGEGCALPGFPGVYTRLAPYKWWILQHTRYGPFGSVDGFVAQQFLDYSGRPPTPAEANFWRYTLTNGSQPGSLIIDRLGDNAWMYTAGSLDRLYRASFLRDPDSSGMRYWVGQLWAGRSLAGVATFFASSAEFTTRYGSLDDGAFVDLVYQNVLGRAPDAGGRSYWVGRLQSGPASLTRGGLMIGFSDSSEYRSATDADVLRQIEWFGALRRMPTPAELVALRTQNAFQIAQALPANPEYNTRIDAGT